MNVKYRIHEMAKDFNMPSKRIVELLGEYGIIPKNHMQVLEPDQLNYLFDRLTAENQTADIQALLREQATTPRTEKKEAEKPAKAETKPEPKQAKPESKKQETKSAPKAEPKPEVKPEVKAEEPKPEIKPEVKPEPAPEVKPEVKAEPVVTPEQPKAAEAVKPEEMQKQEAVEQKMQEEKPKAAPGAKPLNPQNNRGERRNRFDNAQPAMQPRKPEPKKQEPKKQEQPRANTITLSGRQDDDRPVVVTAAEEKSKGHKIDTRGASVNLERYDERVDKFVPDQLANSAGASKQKLTKKNNDKKGFGNKRRQEEADKLKKLHQQEVARKTVLKVMIPDEIAVGELATRLKKTAADVIKQLMKLGIMASVSQFIDFDTASLVAMEFGAKVEHEVIMTIEDRLIDNTEDADENLQPRSPVVVVMGHVDHGKTSLLDSIRRTNVASGEAGGITQHIGAYRVTLNGRDITFLDTPGHAAFTSMRARGASVTDVVILVVAADDGIMPQTIEAINHAKAANAPIVVAINKIDKHNAQPDRILNQLTEHGLVPEQWGGDTICCPISALLGEGIENLLEMVLLTADMMDLKANPDRAAKGTVIEARLDKGRGPVATVLVQNGTLHSGDIIIAGKSVGHVRVMTDYKGKRIDSAGPSVPAEIIGLSEVPSAGDLFYAVDDERMARELVEQRKEEEKAEAANAIQRVSLDSLFDYIKEGEMKEFNIIVKADVTGTAEAVKASLEKLSNEEVRVKVIHAAAGAVNESDVMLANASNAVIVGFNVRPSIAAEAAAHADGVDMRMYRVIYDCLEEMEAAMKGMLAPKFREATIGHVQVRQIFKVSGVGTIAGCYVQNGKIVRNAKVRVVRDGVVIHEGELASLKRFKDDVKEVASGYECGLSVEKYNDIKVDDVIEAYIIEEIRE
ncbi:MAG: translation initiation factor IF-2 [Ruminococcaceae bacterium]|nr:translation initiation factor IF-2 [Oscillospiraceae bacterium]